MMWVNEWHDPIFSIFILNYSIIMSNIICYPVLSLRCCNTSRLRHYISLFHVLIAFYSENLVSKYLFILKAHITGKSKSVICQISG